MSSSIVELHADEVIMSSKKMISQAQDFHQEFTAAVRAVEDALSQGWSGVAAQRFSRSWEEWKIGCKDLIASLESTGRKIGADANAISSYDVYGIA